MHAIRRSRYENGNEGKNVRMDRCPSFLGEVRVLCIGCYMEARSECYVYAGEISYMDYGIILIKIIKCIIEYLLINIDIGY